MRKLASTTAIALSLGLVGTALADELFMQLDADSDNQITRDEFITYNEATYTGAVKNPDDALFTRDYEEQRIHRDDEPVDTVNFDADQDDKVSMEEAMADWDNSFQSLDENGDGAIDESEWAAVGK